MKNNNRHTYSDISSFKDFHFEKKHLNLKKELVEARLRLNYNRISNVLSISGSLYSVAKGFVFSRISNILDWLLKKVEK